jgi:hypothetical protein
MLKRDGAVLALAVAALSSAAACGGGGTDKPPARAAFDDFITAERERDSEGYCDALTTESQRLVARDIARAGDVPRGTSCVEAVGVRFVNADKPPDYTTAGKVTQPVRATSDRATFLIASPLLKARGQKLVVVLVRRGDSWRVDLRQGGIRPRPST